MKFTYEYVYVYPTRNSSVKNKEHKKLFRFTMVSITSDLLVDFECNHTDQEKLMFECDWQK